MNLISPGLRLVILFDLDGKLADWFPAPYDPQPSMAIAYEFSSNNEAIGKVQPIAAFLDDRRGPLPRSTLGQRNCRKPR